VSLDESINVNASVICAIPFSSQENIPSQWLLKIGENYARSLQARNIGAMVRFFDSYRNFLVHRRECHLLLEGSVERMVATGGGQPQELAVLVQIRDVATERVVFSVQQEGISYPGRDTDLYWSTKLGEASFPIRTIIRAMSDQFGIFLQEEVVKNLRKSSKIRI
jgi:hypothetical protein